METNKKVVFLHEVLDQELYTKAQWRQIAEASEYIESFDSGISKSELIALEEFRMQFPQEYTQMVQVKMNKMYDYSMFTV